MFENFCLLILLILLIIAKLLPQERFESSLRTFSHRLDFQNRLFVNLFYIVDSITDSEVEKCESEAFYCTHTQVKAFKFLFFSELP